MSKSQTTIVFQPGLYDQLVTYWQNKHPDISMGKAIEGVIQAGLANSDKARLKRQTLGWPRQGGGKRFTLSMNDDVWNLVEKHRHRYKIASRNEAVRELLRLGLGLPEPTEDATTGYARPSRLPANRKMIVDMAQRGVGLEDIASTIGISRWRVSRVLREEMATNG